MRTDASILQYYFMNFSSGGGSKDVYEKTENGIKSVDLLFLQNDLTSLTALVINLSHCGETNLVEIFRDEYVAVVVQQETIDLLSISSRQNTRITNAQKQNQ